MRNIGILLIIFILFSTTRGAFAQGIIRVLDKQSGQGLPFANLCFETISGKTKTYATTGTDGTLVNPVKERTVLAVSYVGYAAVLDTIQSGESVTVRMDISSNQVDEVIVTGQFKAQVADKSVYKVDVIGADRIQAKAANNLGELLMSDLSFRTSQSSALGTGISMQGLSGEHIKILIDGVPVIGRQDGMIDLGQLSLADVDHIETIKGPMSVVYGSNAMAGAINIITKKDARGRSGIDASAYYESVGVYNADLALRQKVKNNSLILNGSRHFFGGYSPVDLGRFQLWKPKLQYDASGDWIWSSGSWKTRLNESWFREEVRDKGMLMAPYFVNAIDNYYYTTRSTTRTELSKDFDSRSGLELTAAWSFYQKVKKTVNKDLVNLVETPAASSLQDTTIFHNFMSRPVFHSSIGENLEYQTGLDINYDDVVGKRIDGKKSIGDYAGFLSVQWSPLKNLTLQPGMRLIYNTKFDAPLVYSLSIHAQPLSELTMRATVGRGYRSPSIKELYLNFQDINHNVTGNPDLQAESSWNYNVSGNVSHEFGETSLSGELSLFHNRMMNKIDFVYKKEDPTWAKYVNIPGLSKTQGAEATFSLALHPRFRFNAGVALTGRSKILNPDSYYYYTDYSSDWSYHNLKYNFVLAMFYKYTGKMYTARGSFDVDNSLTDVTESYQDGYQTIDVTLSRPFFRNQLTLSLGGKNLLNVKNVFSTGGGDGAHSGGSGDLPAGWGRTFFVKAAWKFIRY